MPRITQLLLGLTASMAVTACGLQEKSRTDDEVAAPVVRQAVPEETTVPTVDQPLERRDLLLAAMEAGSNHALGLDDKAEQQKLDGRTFIFRIRLCGGAANVTQSFDEAERVLKIEVEPDLGLESPIVRQVSARAVAAEGFWVPHPYLLQHGCPRTSRPQAGTGPAQMAPGQKVGIAQFFGPDDIRADQRRSRPYSITETLAGEQAPEPVDLVLQGRLKRLVSGRVITCSDAPDSDRPDCLISATIDRVRLETATGTSLGEWSRS